jgi:hypothetical protein
MLAHVSIRILPSKQPLDASALAIAALLPSVDLFVNGDAIRQAVAG